MNIFLIQCHSELPKRLYNILQGTKHKLLVHNEKMSKQPWGKYDHSSLEELFQAPVRNMAYT